MTRVWHSSQTARAGLARGVRTDGKTSEEAEQQEQVMGTDKWGHCRETQAGTGPGECAGPGGLSGPSTCRLQFPGRGCGPERARRLSVHIRHARFPGTATPTRPHTSGATFPLTGRVGAENEQRTACKPSSVHYVSLRRKDLPVPG